MATYLIEHEGGIRGSYHHAFYGEIAFDFPKGKVIPKGTHVQTNPEPIRGAERLEGQPAPEGTKTIAEIKSEQEEFILEKLASDGLVKRVKDEPESAEARALMPEDERKKGTA